MCSGPCNFHLEFCSVLYVLVISSASFLPANSAALSLLATELPLDMVVQLYTIYAQIHIMHTPKRNNLKNRPNHCSTLYVFHTPTTTLETAQHKFCDICTL